MLRNSKEKLKFEEFGHRHSIFLKYNLSYLFYSLFCLVAFHSSTHSSLSQSCSQGQIAQPRSTRVISVSSQQSKHSAASSQRIPPTRPHTFPLLIIITFWTSLIVQGPLSSVAAHACYPTGDDYFIFGSLVANGAMLLGCVMSMRLYRGSRVKVIIALTSLGTITLIYFAALIGFNHTMADKSQIFQSNGEMLSVGRYV